MWIIFLDGDLETFSNLFKLEMGRNEIAHCKKANSVLRGQVTKCGVPILYDLIMLQDVKFDRLSETLSTLNQEF